MSSGMTIERVLAQWWMWWSAILRIYECCRQDEQIAVALVLDRQDLFPHGGYTILESVERLGREWLQAALKVQRARDIGPDEG